MSVNAQSLKLINHHVMKTYGDLEVDLLSFLTSQLHAPEPVWTRRMESDTVKKMIALTEK
jgi:hypothetical protein